MMIEQNKIFKDHWTLYQYFVLFILNWSQDIQYPEIKSVLEKKNPLLKKKKKRSKFNAAVGCY